MRKTLICLLGIFLLIELSLFTGCSSRTFAPIAVPARYATVPEVKTEAADLSAKLKALHEPDNSPYKITPGDQFNISVYEHQELGQVQIVVTPDGFISIPLVGPVKIGGLTLVEANDLLKVKMSEYIRNPIISLIPVRINGYNYTIVGRVNYPGSYPISIGSTRLIDAIAAARGLAQGVFHGDTIEMADLDNSYISRNGEILPVDFKKALIDGDALNNIPLRNNDYIYIPSTMNSNVALLGEVRNPTYVGYKEGMTVLQALPFAQGLTESYNDEIKIIRGGLKSPVVYTVNVRDMLNGKAMDFKLAPNDIVYFPPDGLSEWNIMVRKILPSLQSLNMLAGPFGNPSGYVNFN